MTTTQACLRILSAQFRRAGGRAIWLSLTCLLAATEIAPAQAATETILHTFGNFPKGANPFGTLIRNASGDLFGTTYQGGAANLGTVFVLGPAGGYKVLHSFIGGTSDGSGPYAGVVQDSAGSLYGTTYTGGASGKGVVYKVTATGQETVLYSFTGGADGSGPYAGVILDPGGNLYGTTYNGGTANAGVVYKLSPSGQETVLHNFIGGETDGANPYAGVTRDAAGNLYGTTYFGGGGPGVFYNAGVVYKLSPSGQETVLYTCHGGGGGAYPKAGVVLDPAGNLYGTNSGAVYRLSATGEYTVLYAFLGYTGVADAGVARDTAGNLYGTTTPPGLSNAPYGVVYKLSSAGQLTWLYKFPGPSKTGDSIAFGANPGVVLDSAGNLYGATPNAGLAGMVYKVDTAGQQATLYSFPPAPRGTYPEVVAFGPGGDLYGTTCCGGGANVGLVYKMDAAGHVTVLHSFEGGTDGAYPSWQLAFDAAGNLYGATVQGGTANQGTVFKVDTSGRETVLYTFTGGADGGYPNGVIIDPAGNLYGTTAFGGAGSKTGLQEGVVFKLDPSGRETLLYSFTGLSDGGLPEAGVIRDSAGNLYGTTDEGGLGAGVVYEVSAAGQYKVLHAFTGGADGGYPFAPVIRDSAGNLYGTVSGYGAGGAGVVYKLDPVGQYTALYSFTGGTDGGSPTSGVVRDPAGNLYGANVHGGTPSCYLDIGCGVVYKLDTSGQLTVLHSFTGGPDGSGSGAPIRSPAGSLFAAAGGGIAGGGLLYKLTLP